MNTKDIKKKHTQIASLLYKQQIAEALDELKIHMQLASTDEFNVLCANIEQTYQLVLKYAIKGVADPQRPFIIKQLVKSLLELNDRLREELLSKEPSETGSLKKLMRVRSGFVLLKMKEMQDEGLMGKQISELFEGTNVETSDTTENNYTALLGEFFNYVWLTDIFTDDDSTRISQFISSEVHEWQNKALIVSALTLNAIRFFNPPKIHLLIALTKNAPVQIAERAFTGLMLALFVHDKRIMYYPDIEASLSLLHEEAPHTENFTAFFLIQMIKAADTEKFTRKFRDEIMPDIMKHAPGLRDKLDLDNILPENFDEDKNPDWEKILGTNKDLLNRLEELSKLQMEGTDVFMSTFAMLKEFPFFRYMPNWFLPFYSSNSTVQQTLINEGSDFRDVFLTSLEKSGHMCNSDKYSFCLNIKSLPESQKTMMLQMFKQELESINELNDADDLLNHHLISKRIITHYIQDIYRFFKLYPNKGEYTDVFALKQDFHKRYFFRTYFAKQELLVIAASYYFDAGQYEQAADIYDMLAADGLNTQVVFEKAGFAYQQRGLYQKALDSYRKAELFAASGWVSRQMALCYTRLGELDEALKCYHEAANAEPENLKIQLSIANTYLSKGDTETALNHYYRLELQENANVRLMRPISWCLFVLGRFAEAEDYFIRIFDSRQANHNDSMNYAHLFWCTGRTEEAARYYLQSLKHKDSSPELFFKSLAEDTKHLHRHGISEEDLALMKDYIKIFLAAN